MDRARQHPTVTLGRSEELDVPGRVRVFGRSLPAWTIVLTAIVGASGAATGTVLVGDATGVISATASQALTIRQASGTGLTNADRGLITVEDDGTGFHASAQVHTGDLYKIDLALSNASSEELTGEIALFPPPGITLEAEAAVAGDIEAVGDVVPVGPFSWRFRLRADAPAGAGDPDNTDMTVLVAIADDLPPGFYQIDGTLSQVAK